MKRKKKPPAELRSEAIVLAIRKTSADAGRKR
jgi:hypothetical protein